MSRRPRSTYSIVARDAEGALGVAVQSHWFNVGAVVPWVDPAVGAVAVQSFSGPEIGFAALEHLRGGRTASQTVEAIVADDVQRVGGQIAIVTPDGAVVARTGGGCIPEAGDHLGAGYSAQANLMDTDAVWGAMGAAFEAATGDLAERLLLALDAGQAAGGDIRGQQSAAIVVAMPGVPPPLDRIFDLRVEDHPRPVDELRRLITIRRAFILLNDGDRLVARHEVGAALEAYRAAADVVDDSVTDGEAAFWTAIALATEDLRDDAEGFMRRAGARSDRWARLIPRLVQVGILPDDPALVERLVRVASDSTVP